MIKYPEKSYVENDIRCVLEKVGYSEIDAVLDLLDEMELDRKLAIGLAEADRGEGRPVEEFMKELNEKFANGYFSKENATKRIESGMYANYL